MADGFNIDEWLAKPLPEDVAAAEQPSAVDAFLAQPEPQAQQPPQTFDIDKWLSEPETTSNDVSAGEMTVDEFLASPEPNIPTPSLSPAVTPTPLKPVERPYKSQPPPGVPVPAQMPTATPSPVSSPPMGIQQPITPDAELSELQAKNLRNEKVDFLEAIKPTRYDIPFAGDVLEVIDAKKVYSAAKKVQENQSLEQDEALSLAKYIERQKRNANMTFMGEVGNVLRNSIVFGTEILVGLATLGGGLVGKAGTALGVAGGKKAASAAVKKALAEAVTKKVAKIAGSKAAATAIGKATVVAADLGTKALILHAVRPGAAALAYEQRKINNLFNSSDETEKQALLKSQLDVLFEHVSEMSGAYLGAAFAKMMPAKLKARLGAGVMTAFFGRKYGAQKVDAIWNILQKAGFSGVASEMMEEREGDFLRGLFGVQGKEPNALVNAIKEATPTWRQLGVEALAFSIPSVAATAPAIAAQQRVLYTLDWAEKNAAATFGRENVVRVDDGALEINLGKGRGKIRIEPTDEVDIVGKEAAYLKSISEQGPLGKISVDAALKSSGNDIVKAANMLAKGRYMAGIRGWTYAPVVSDSQGNQIPVRQVIELLRGTATRGTFKHEMFHALSRIAGLTPAEAKELDQTFHGEEDNLAYALERYTDSPIMNRIRAALDRVVALFGITGERPGETANRIYNALTARGMTEGANPWLPDFLWQPSGQAPQYTGQTVEDFAATQAEEVPGAIPAERAVEPSVMPAELRRAEIDSELAAQQAAAEDAEVANAVPEQEANAIPVPQRTGAGEAVGEEVRGAEAPAVAEAEEAVVPGPDSARFSVTPEQDAEYMAAVERGDEKTAQRMVDEAARAAGYNVGPVWHGTKSGDFNEFRTTGSTDPVGRLGAMFGSREAARLMSGQDDQFWLHPSQRTAIPPGSRLRSFFIRLTNPKHVGRLEDAESLSRSELESQGRDGVIIDGVWGGKPTGYDTEYVVFSPSQIKSADAVTRDDAGNVIPLSQRFNPESPDIRFSVAEAQDAAAEVHATGDPVSPKVRKALPRFVNWFAKWFFGGEAMYRHPGMYEKAWFGRHEYASSATRAADMVEMLMNDAGLRTKPEVDDIISYALDDTRLVGQLDERQTRIYNLIVGVRDYFTKMQQDAGVLGEKVWPESQIASLEQDLKKLSKGDAKAAEIQRQIDSLKEIGSILEDTGKEEQAENAQEVIANLKEQLKKADTADKKAEIEEQIAGLEHREYWSHRIIARAFQTLKFRRMGSQEQGRLIGKLKELHQKRKGKQTLKEYADILMAEGILTRKDFDPVLMAMEHLTDAYQRVAMRGILDYAEQQNLVVDENAEVDGAPDDWRKGGNISVKLPSLKGKKVHVILDNILRELAQVDKAPRTAFDKLLAITKVGQFFVPGIIISYNILQRHMRGMGEYNPFKAVMQLRDAWRLWVNHGPEWESIAKYGVMQNPRLPTRSNEEETLDLAARRVQEDIPDFAKTAERIFGKRLYLPRSEWSDALAKHKNPARAMLDAIMLPYRALSNLTWAVDELQRIGSYIKYLEQYTPKELRPYVRLYGDEFNALSPELKEKVIAQRKEAADYVAHAHAAYAMMSNRYQDLMARIFFVHTFRVMMPIEVGKSMYGLPYMIGKQILGKGKYTTSQYHRAGKAMVMTMLLPFAVHSLMVAAGYEPDEDAVPDWVKKLSKTPWGLPFPTWKNHWKYRKTIRNPDTGKTKEIVVGVNDLLNMTPKWINRATVERPEKLDDMWWHVGNLLKWEINPFYRIVFDAIVNESTMGGRAPRNLADPQHKQLKDTLAYVFGGMFRLYSDGLPIVGYVRGKDETSVKREVKQDLAAGMSLAEKMLLGYYTGYVRGGQLIPTSFGYSYSRQERRQRLGFALEELDRAVSREKGRIKKTYRDQPDIMRDMISTLQRERVRRRLRLRDIFLGGSSNE